MATWRRCAECGVEMDYTWQAIKDGSKCYHPACWQGRNSQQRDALADTLERLLPQVIQALREGR